MHISLGRFFYLTIYGVVKYLPTPIGDLLRSAVLTLFVKRLQTLWVHEGVTIHNPEKVSIGRGTSLNEFVFLNGFGGLTIGDFVAMGAGASVFSFEHGFEDRSLAPYHQPIEPRPVVIEDQVYVGARAIILGGVRIGKGAVVGAASLVDKDVPPYAIVAGVPARVIRYRGESR